jgi:hypothetical protein
MQNLTEIGGYKLKNVTSLSKYIYGLTELNFLFEELLISVTRDIRISLTQKCRIQSFTKIGKILRISLNINNTVKLTTLFKLLRI